MRGGALPPNSFQRNHVNTQKHAQLINKGWSLFSPYDLNDRSTNYNKLNIKKLGFAWRLYIPQPWAIFQSLVGTNDFNITPRCSSRVPHRKNGNTR